MIDKFIELIESRVDDEEKKEGLIGFAKDAKEDPRKEEALEKFMEQYRHEDGTKCKVVIGKDTRRSSYMFEYALVAGLTASGADAY